MSFSGSIWLGEYGITVSELCCLAGWSVQLNSV